MRLGSLIVALTSLFAIPVLAADLPKTKEAPPPTAPIAYDWSGFYIGGTAGAAWSDANIGLDPVNGAPPNYFAADIPGVAALGSSSLKAANPIFGGKAGYNFQSGMLVFGLEGDISSFRFRGSAKTSGNPFTDFGVPFPFGSAAFNSNVSTDWLATIRPRFGVAIERALFYGTGGLAYGNVGFSNTYVDLVPLGAGNGQEASSASGTRLGWTLGAGVDYAVTDHWIVSAEYLHVDLGSIKASGLVTSGNPNTATLNFSTMLKSDLMRAGVGYKF
jgi:outer membrane immunogenic protein